MTPQTSFAAKGGPYHQARSNDGARSRSPGNPASSQGFTVDSAYLQRLQMQQAALIRQQQQLELQRAQQAEQQIQAQQQTVAIQMAMQALNRKVVQAQNIARINNWTLDEAIHQMGGFTQNELDLLKLAVVREQQAKELANLQVLQAQIHSRQQQMQLMAQAGPLGFGSSSFPTGFAQGEDAYNANGSRARNTIDPSLPLPTAENNMGSAMEQRLAAKQQIEANLRARSEMAQVYGGHRRTHSRGQSMNQRIIQSDSGYVNPQHSHMISPPPSSSSHGSGTERQRGFAREPSVSPPPSQILTPPHREPSDNEATPRNPGKKDQASRVSNEEHRPAYNAFNAIIGNSASPPSTVRPASSHSVEADAASRQHDSNRPSRADSPTSVSSSIHVPSRRSPSTGSSSVDEMVLRGALHNGRKQDVGVIGQNTPAGPAVVVLRQPLGPPGSADELGGKNFASRIRRKAGLDLSVLGRRAVSPLPLARRD
ncbi:hypothetical protein NCC49_004449 [Naganishia albida]|nr:hypothetical protein NCC49_004449 [Naganishia albida]